RRSGDNLLGAQEVLDADDAFGERHGAAGVVGGEMYDSGAGEAGAVAVDVGRLVVEDADDAAELTQPRVRFALPIVVGELELRLHEQLHARPRQGEAEAVEALDAAGAHRPGAGRSRGDG